MNLPLVLVGAVGPAVWAVQLLRYWAGVDDVLRELHGSHREVWVELGSPCGWQWAPPGRFATPFSICTDGLDWRDGEEPDWLQAVGIGLAGQIRQVRALGRTMPRWIACCVVGALVVVWGLAS